MFYVFFVYVDHVVCFDSLGVLNMWQCQFEKHKIADSSRYISYQNKSVFLNCVELNTIFCFLQK